MKTIEELRAEFEETEVFNLFYSWHFDFDISNNFYYTYSDYKSDVDSLNSAWMMFQELNK